MNITRLIDNCPSARNLHCLVLAGAIPLAATVLQSLLWGAIQPYVWFLFYPAVFLSSWVGGLWGGLTATVISVVSVWWFFIPPQYSFVLERPSSALAIGVFAAMGVLFSLTQERLRKASSEVAEALAEVKAAKKTLEHQVGERTAELARANKALQESEEQLKLFFEHAPAALAMFDREMCYIAVSRRWVDDFGLWGKGIIGQSHYDIFTEIGADLKAVHLRGLAGEIVRSDEDRFERANGSIQWLRWEVHPWYAVGGQVGGIVIFTEDITERKRAEEEHRELIDELGKRNAELERFTYTVSHDLKSPLVTILGFIGQLEQDLADDDPDNVKADMAFISSAANQMHELLDSLLHLSRAGRAISEPRSVDLPLLVQEVLNLFDDRLAHARLLVEIPTGLPAIKGDPLRLREVWQNLLENAAKFTVGQPDPCIEIGCVTGEGEILCHVRDNGPGIPVEFQEKVFGLFEKLDASMEGTGIGLAIVRRIVEEHGGRVWVESAGPGQGSTFSFSLPAGDRQ